MNRPKTMSISGGRKKAASASNAAPAQEGFTPVHERFKQQARRTPEALALVGKRQRYTYAQLDVITDRMAAHLQASGVGPEIVVGCWSHDAVTTVLQVLAVIKAGGAYLLLDPHLPAERLRYMIADTKPYCFLADRPLPTRLKATGKTLLVSKLLHTDARLRPSVLHAKNVLYVAYTSGSTGRPKGVQITHGATANHAQAFSRLFALRPGDRLPLMAPAAFDMATEEMLPPLTSGCTLLDAPLRSPAMEAFTEDVLGNGYTILNIPAPLWHQWTTYLHKSGLSIPPSLRLLIAGSDKIYTSKFAEWQTLPGAEHVWWVAAYGVTEATVTSLVYTTAARDDLSGEALMPIGTPLDNVTAYVVTEEGQLAREGEPGELYIGGAGLARGYQNLPEKTAEVFVAGHFGAQGGRLYKTGDLVRRGPGGALLWLGRKDAQIKINGLRIEPAEIEAVIHEHATVGEAVVAFISADKAEQNGSLVAYLEPAAGKRILPAAIRRFLQSRLHPLMVPSEIIILDTIPLNANGKIDYKALRNPIQKGSI